MARRWAPADGKRAVTGQTEPLRLFDDPAVTDRALGQPPSQDSLTEVARAARLVGEAQQRLTRWIRTARDEGHSWRRIGTAAGIAHQTLHRRCRASRSTSSPPVSDLD